MEFAASRNVPPQIAFSDGGVLKVTGTKVDTIHATVPAPSFTKITGVSKLDDTFIRGLEKTEKWIREVISIANPRHLGSPESDGLERVYQTLVCELTEDGFPAPQI